MAKYTATSNWNYRLKISPAPSKLAKLFGEAAREFSDYKPALLRCAPKVLDGIRRIMGSRGSSLGEPWPGLKDKYYLARKARKGWSRAEMKATGALESSIGVISCTKRALKVGTRLKQARALQWGTSRGMPSRKFIGLDDLAMQQCVEELNAHANALLDRLASKINTSEAAA
jgi:phage gpG-like protein